MGNKSSRPKNAKREKTGFFGSVWRPKPGASTADTANADASNKPPPDPGDVSTKPPPPDPADVSTKPPPPDPDTKPPPDPADDASTEAPPDPADASTDATPSASEPEPESTFPVPEAEPEPDSTPEPEATATFPKPPEPESATPPPVADSTSPLPDPVTMTTGVAVTFTPELTVGEFQPPHQDMDARSDTTATTTATEDHDDSEKLKKPFQMKRVVSAGLEADSVLGRRTASIKDIYDLGRKLGQGQFGTTFLCVDKTTGMEYACKSIAKRKLVTVEDVEDVRREIQIMHHLAGHPNVIQIVGAYEDAVAVHVVMDLCVGGELFDRIIERGHYTERKAAELARVIVQVVETCHSLGVMHRDLKPENFLFVNHDEDALLKTIDFGLSIFFKPGEIFTDVVGSPYYVAPEVLRKQYGPECDVWSAGVIIYILLCGVPPFWDENEQGIFEQVLQGDPDFISEPWPSISEGAIDLVSNMLSKDPKDRMTAQQVLCHPWLQVDGDAADNPIDTAVISRLRQFSAMNKLKKMAIRKVGIPHSFGSLVNIFRVGGLIGHNLLVSRDRSMIIAENLSEEEIAGLKQMFKMIDTDASGQITLEELKCGLEKVGANLQDSELISLMQAADVDNSGTIDYGEFLAAMLHLNKIQKEDHLFTAFSYFDKDGSGYITADELQQACEQFGLEDVRLEDIINEVDQDHDGRIDYSEFVAMMQDTGIVKKIRM